MNKPKRMILGLIPNNTCNLRCSYCYISQTPKYMAIEKDFSYDVEHIARCLSAKRLGGICLINLTGQGETMLQKNIVKLCELLLKEGHYIEFVTNLTVTMILNEFLNLPDVLLERLEFKISFHYKELKEKGLLDIFFKNVNKVQNSPCSFTLELMPNDDILNETNSIMELCQKEVGANCQLTVGRADYLSSRGLLTKMTKSDYIEKWSRFESPMFRLKMDLLDRKRHEFCYAGDWTLFVNMYTGEASQCYAQPYKQNIFKDINKPIEFRAVGNHCREPFCINGHAHIALGVIPELKAPTYAEIRNRKREDGTEWLKKDLKDFFDTKLYETNETYNCLKKVYVNISWYFRALIAVIKYPDKVKRKIRLMKFQLENKKKNL